MIDWVFARRWMLFKFRVQVLILVVKTFKLQLIKGFQHKLVEFAWSKITEAARTFAFFLLQPLTNTFAATQIVRLTAFSHIIHHVFTDFADEIIVKGILDSLFWLQGCFSELSN